MPEFHDHDLVVVPVKMPPGSAIPLLIYGDGKISRLAYDYITSPRMSGLSSTSKDQAVKAVGLLHDFHQKVARTSKRQAESAERFLDRFCKALIYGTVQSDGSCPYELYWHAKSWEHASNYIRQIQRFLKSFIDENDTELAVLTEWRFLSFSLSAYAQEAKAHFSLLFHLSENQAMRNSSFPIQRGQNNPRAPSTTNAFPANKVWSMIFDGCAKANSSRAGVALNYSERFNVRNQLAYLLIFMGGLRESNLFHIFSNDVLLDAAGGAQVNVYHPTKGTIRHSVPGSSKAKFTTRQEFLVRNFSMQPRNMLHKKMPLFAGWKNLLLTRGAPHYFSQVHWIHPSIGPLFWKLHCLYMLYVRPATCAHPYYFVSLGHQTFGEPWKISAFVDAFRASARRIGLEPSKHFGTTPHGGRHYFGLSAANLQIDPRVRQVMMMHRHIASQHRYQVPSPKVINDTISQAFVGLSRTPTSSELPASSQSRPSFYDPLAYLTSEIDLMSAIEAELAGAAQ